VLQVELRQLLRAEPACMLREVDHKHRLLRGEPARLLRY
jgi:hypothetical protein